MRVEIDVEQTREPTRVHAYRALPLVVLKPYQSPRAARPEAMFAVSNSGFRRRMLEDRPTKVFVAGFFNQGLQGFSVDGHSPGGERPLVTAGSSRSAAKPPAPLPLVPP